MNCCQYLDLLFMMCKGKSKSGRGELKTMHKNSRINQPLLIFCQFKVLSKNSAKRHFDQFLWHQKSFLRNETKRDKTSKVKNVSQIFLSPFLFYLVLRNFCFFQFLGASKILAKQKFTLIILNYPNLTQLDPI